MVENMNEKNPNSEKKNGEMKTIFLTALVTTGVHFGLRYCERIVGEYVKENPDSLVAQLYEKIWPDVRDYAENNLKKYRESLK